MRKNTKKTTKTAVKDKKSFQKRSCSVRSIGEILPDIGGPIFRRFGFLHSTIVSRWSYIVGEKYARFSLPESIRFSRGKTLDGTLSIVAEGGIATQMQHINPAIIERVNRFFGYSAVAQVKFRQGRVLDHKNKNKKNVPSPPTEFLQSYLAEEDIKLVQNVHNSDLQTSLIRLGGYVSLASKIATSEANGEREKDKT
ncbi:hypothetical protein ZMO02_09860 [Zymomonas mobilis subsp. pomaceae]|nr:hypothetical protein ZMO02_09860 [Zymomonas mobilis subsp. pomaceae]